MTEQTDSQPKHTPGPWDSSMSNCEYCLRAVPIGSMYAIDRYTHHEFVCADCHAKATGAAP